MTTQLQLVVVVVTIIIIRYPSSQKQSCAEYKAHVTPQHVSIQVPLILKIKPGSIA
jgi:hypothetical protein